MKKSLIFIPVLLFILGSLAWFSWQKNKSQTGSGQSGGPVTTKTPVTSTYESPSHKLSFNYPADWQLTVVKEDQEGLNLDLKKDDSSQPKIAVYDQEPFPSYSISVSVEKNDQGLSAKELYLNQFDQSSRVSAETAIKEVSYGGLMGIQYPEGVVPASGPATAILLAQGAKAYRFIYSALATKETHEKYLPEFYRLLESLKFLE